MRMDRSGRPDQFIRCSARALPDLWPRWGRRLFRGALCHRMPDSRFDSLASVPVTGFLPTPLHYRLGVYYEKSGEPCVTASRAHTAQAWAGGSQRRILGMFRSPTVLPLIYVTPVSTVPSSCYPAPSLEPIFGQYLGSGGSTDDQKMCVNEGWCLTFEYLPRILLSQINCEI